MDKPARYKGKNKKPAVKPKTAKKRKSEGPTCSMFLAELTRKLAMKKKQEEESPKNIVQTIIESITNALPIKFSKRTPPKKDSPMKIETLQSFAPELISKDTVALPPLTGILIDDEPIEEMDIASHKSAFKMPKMPLVNSEVLKIAVDKRRRAMMQDASVNTGCEHDVASEIEKHVGTLKKISLIAEEFNQKTAKSLKEIVDSVQEDLMRKLEEINSQQLPSTSKNEQPNKD
ncbi:uncharacterized protein LOC115445654 [Manduca sexta]|nr:uncharacterized protein LOC115445654 [Manduca sexta]